MLKCSKGFISPYFPHYIVLIKFRLINTLKKGNKRDLIRVNRPIRFRKINLSL